MVCTSLESAHAAVAQLVNDFAANEAHYLSPGYSEAQARLSFIDKLWQALGWDVTHQLQKNPYAQEVKVEDPQKIQGANRRADYAFHTAPNFRDARFFCEAKKPSVQLKSDADAAFQTIRYGWSAGTPLAVLTDFEQLHILDCRAKPDIQTALARSHRYFHYKDWLDPDKFAQLYYLFSREAFRDGGFDAYVSKLPRPKKVGQQLGLLRTGTQPVDAAFLLDLEGYRAELAKLLKAADHALDGDALTGLVQRILDRLVFLRFLEDKLIETEIQVQHFSRAAGGHSWAKFLAASRKLNDRYNGIVFKFTEELDTPGRLPVDDARFADLCEDLSHTKSPYDFNAIPIHILGSIYERFLGKVIVTTAQRATVEEKPEVRKAGGVYYTPEYIVRYICEQTVGRLIEGKSPTQIAKMRFADIACGSGSFLLGVYDLLLRHHGLWYNAHQAEAVKENLAPPDKSKKRKKEFIPAVVEHAGVLRLTLEKKRDILINNVFGVDLDPQAVEVAQLSLYLKLLEDETTASAAQHYLDFHEALLPSLNRNVIRGNSLIGTDILFQENLAFTPREETKLHAMDYASAFPSAMKDGGFDAVVGNPPYGMLQPHNTPPPLLDYLRRHFVAVDFKIEMFHLFLQRALGLVKTSGRLGYIVPTTLLNNVYAETLRRHLASSACINEICVAHGRVFADADVHTSILIFTPEEEGSKRLANSIHTTTQLSAEWVKTPQHEGETEQKTYAKLPGAVWNILITNQNRQLLLRLASMPRLDGAGTINRGLITGDRSKYFAPTKVSSKYIPIIAGGDVHRYRCNPPSEYVLFVRPDSAGGCWDPEVHLAKHKLVVRQIATEPTASLLEDPFAVTGNIFTVRSGSLSGDKFLLGLINSRISRYFWKTMFADFKASFPQVTIFSLAQLPVPKLSLKNPAEKKQHDRMVQLVEAMLATQQQLAAATSENHRSYYESKAAGLDRQIDELTYDLYGLTDEERALVAGSGA